jgi:hypothetical protein
MQEIITYVLVFTAIIFLIKKFFFPPKDDKGCGTGCGSC